MDSFPSYKIHVVTFDTECYNPAHYDSDNLDSMIDYEVSGGGGTDFDCIFTYLKAEENHTTPTDCVHRRLPVWFMG
jgi:predicted metal-dependent peptidase